MIKIREGNVSDRYSLARILINATHSAFADRVPEKSLSSLGVQESADNWKRSIQADNDGEFLLVAEIESLDVIGFILAGRDPRDSISDPQIIADYSVELTSIQIEPAWQGVGIGKELVQRVATDLIKRDYHSLLVRVLADNPNIGFYEHLGATRLGSRDYNWEGYQTNEFIYGWSDLLKLVVA
jgi:ribosomal protein S18 acetylase RimI-like enzyme